MRERELRTANPSWSLGRSPARTKTLLCLYHVFVSMVIQMFTYRTTINVAHLDLVFPIFDRLNIKHFLAGGMTIGAGYHVITMPLVALFHALRLYDFDLRA